MGFLGKLFGGGKEYPPLDPASPEGTRMAPYREITVDDAYIKKSMLEPAADVVKGFQPLMPSQQGLVSEGEIKALTAYIKSLK